MPNAVKLVLVATIACALALGGTPEGAAQPERPGAYFSHAALRPAEMRAVRWTEGFWADRYALCRRTMLPEMKKALLNPENAACLINFRIAAGLEEGGHIGANWSDGDCYKWLEALAWMDALQPDPALEKEMDAWIEVIARAQAPDGYINTQIQLDPTKGRWEKRAHHELYNMGHLLTAASAHYAATGKTNFLAVGRKAADYLDRLFGPRPKHLAHFGFNPSQIMGLMDLYRATGEPRYLELAGTFVSMRGSQPWPRGLMAVARTQDPSPGDQTQDRVPLREETQAVGHAVTGGYLYCGAADLAAETGEAKLRRALEGVWLDMTQRKMYLTGANGALREGFSVRGDPVHEAFGAAYDLSPRRGYNETCANIAGAMWSWRMLLLTGEARYADVMETVLYNSMLSAMSLDGERFCYCNPLERRHGAPLEKNDTEERWSVFRCYCCPPSVARTLAKLHTWAYALSGEGLWVNLYGGNTLDQAAPGGGRWRVRQRTEYPWAGAVRLEIAEAPAAGADVFLRIPGWAAGAAVKINGQPAGAEIKAGAYARLSRKWAAGDAIELELPLAPVMLESNPLVEQTRGQVALKRGPLVYCLESIDLPPGMDIDRIVIPAKAQWTARRQADLLGGVTALEAEALARPAGAGGAALYRPLGGEPPAPQRIRMIPYYAWNNRGRTDMSVWLPLR